MPLKYVCMLSVWGAVWGFSALCLIVLLAVRIRRLDKRLKQHRHSEKEV